MIKVVTSEERHTARSGPLRSEFSFSFAEYVDPGNAHFGCLLALNDHMLAPGRKLTPHHHRDLEIVTYVISGTMGYSGEAGRTEILKEGAFQTLSAGSGIEHGEFNPSPDEPVRYLQLWFLPDRKNLPPSCHSRNHSRRERTGALHPVVTSAAAGEGDGLQIHQEVKLFVPVLADDKEIVVPSEKRRQHLFQISGHTEFRSGDQHFPLGPGDAARIQSGHDLVIRKTGEEPAELMIIDMP
ncbi:pirin family protein [Paenibacillus sp. M1]|uniref:Pirin family protein n=1 Tax=Paenibacillus haidiansis TaxID=1574488 RepID=A0ABU7W185_9BACL